MVWKEYFSDEVILSISLTTETCNWEQFIILHNPSRLLIRSELAVNLILEQLQPCLINSNKNSSTVNLFWSVTTTQADQSEWYQLPSNRRGTEWNFSNGENWWRIIHITGYDGVQPCKIDWLMYVSLRFSLHIPELRIDLTWVVWK